MLAARELNIEGLPGNAQTWVNQHITYTHGFGVAMSAVNQVTADGSPDFLVQDVPPRSVKGLEIEEPRIYYGPDTKDYSILDTGIDEFDYPTGQKNAKYRYTGDGGVEVGSSLRRLAWSVRLGSSEVLFSNYIKPSSRVLIASPSHTDRVSRPNATSPDARARSQKTGTPCATI
jgi:uncharacterized membrane protein (UPF0182 family)